MMTVLTLTYKRRALLEEAIYSFLLQGKPDSEMLVINDCPDVWYDFYHPRVRIYNLSERFSSLGKKLEYGFSECRYPYIYRLDDDDLLAPFALHRVAQVIAEHPGFDIYRHTQSYFFNNGVYENLSPPNVNAGNVYSADFVQRIPFPDRNFAEDETITFRSGGSSYEMGGAPTMCYRWGMGVYHVSSLGDVPIDVSYEVADAMGDPDVGYVKLFPQFRQDYWKMLPTPEENTP